MDPGFILQANRGAIIQASLSCKNMKMTGKLKASDKILN